MLPYSTKLTTFTGMVKHSDGYNGGTAVGALCFDYDADEYLMVYPFGFHTISDFVAEQFIDEQLTF